MNEEIKCGNLVVVTCCHIRMFNLHSEKLFSVHFGTDFIGCYRGRCFFLLYFSLFGPHPTGELHCSVLAAVHTAVPDWSNRFT